MSPEQPTYNQVDQQGEGATVLVPRNSGEISIGNFLGQYDQNGNAVVHVTAEDGAPATKLARREGLSDQVQEKLAADLAGIALRSETEYVFDTLLSGSDEQVTALQTKQKAENEERITAGWEKDRLERERASADQKYNLARQAGASHEEAEQSARRAYTRA